MKFDVIVGNPPYQTVNDGEQRSHPLWDKFVINSLEYLVKNGHLLFVHPSAWRAPDGRFKYIQEIFKNKQMVYLKMYNYQSGLDIFNVKINFDYYHLINKLNKSKTKIVFVDGTTNNIDITKLDFIPNDNINDILNLIALPGEATVNIINDSSYHTQKDFVIDNKTKKNKYPVVYMIKSASKGNKPTFWYSDRNTIGHFGLCKIIWASGASGIIEDFDGKYGMTPYASAIVDKKENLIKIKKAMETEKFIKKIMGYTDNLGDRYKRRIISLFKKDFWKYFVDENGNEI